MKLHGNAALSWTGRRRLAERVVVEGWTQTAAAEARWVRKSVRYAARAYSWISPPRRSRRWIWPGGFEPTRCRR